jgi:parvulin-like peptidyl-prolyl isomerase
MQVLTLPYEEYLVSDERPTADEMTAARVVALETAKEALQRIEAGEEFGAVVDDVSSRFKRFRPTEGGVWDYMPAGSFREKTVEEAAFAQQAGQVSGIIETATGVYIVKTRDVKEGVVIPFEQAQDQIDSKLRSRQYDELTTAYFGELATRAKIESATEFERLILDRAVQMYYRQ